MTQHQAETTVENYQIGQGVTVVHHSDQYAYTIVARTPTGHRITIQRDNPIGARNSIAIRSKVVA